MSIIIDLINGMILKYGGEIVRIKSDGIVVKFSCLDQKVGFKQEAGAYDPVRIINLPSNHVEVYFK